jgi:hypothetical protein
VLCAAPGEALLGQTSALEQPKRPGLFAVGPFWVTPRLRLGTLGLDTNVFYTADHRRTDFILDGGPALEIALPTRPVRFDVEGGVTGLYFARTAGQRRVSGDGLARLTFVGLRFHASVEEGYSEAFDRPSFEVDTRVDRARLATRGEVAVELPGRLQLRTALSADRLDVSRGQEFLGTDLNRTLERTTQRALLGLGYLTTAKTSLRLDGDLQVDRFPNAPARNTRSNRLLAGFEVDSKTRLSGSASSGLRFLRPEGRDDGRERLWIALAQLVWHFGPRTRLRYDLRRDADISAFESASSLPIVHSFENRLQLERALTTRVDLALFVRRLTLTSSAPITLVGSDGSSTTARRDDRVLDAGLTLTQRVGRRLRAGLTAGYTSRRSSFADLGIAGLLLGGTLNYAP